MAGQPYFKLLDEPDPNAVAMFELSPALFISGAAKMHGLDIDENKTCRFNVRPVWRLVQLTDGSWYKKADVDLTCRWYPATQYHWYEMEQSGKNSGTPTLPAVLDILGKKNTCFLPLPIFLSLHGWAPVRNHSVFLVSCNRYFSDREYFCDWTPWDGYQIQDFGRTHDTTFLTLSPGGDIKSYRDLCSPPTTLGKKTLMRNWKKPLVEPNPEIEIDMASIENPVPGITVVTNKHGRTLRFRWDGKWICDTCTYFCHGTRCRSTIILNHGYRQAICANDKPPVGGWASSDSMGNSMDC